MGSFAAALLGTAFSGCGENNSSAPKDTGSTDAKGSIEDVVASEEIDVHDSYKNDEESDDGFFSLDSSGDSKDGGYDTGTDEGQKEINPLPCIGGPVAYLDCMYNGNKGKQKHTCQDGEYVPDPDEGCNYGCTKSDEPNPEEKFDEFTKGTCRYYSDGQLVAEEDWCLTDEMLMEYICNKNNQCESYKHLCGSKCVIGNGACQFTACSPCIEKKDGIDNDCDFVADDHICTLDDVLGPSGPCDIKYSSSSYTFDAFPAPFVFKAEFYGKIVVSDVATAEEMQAAELITKAFTFALQACGTCGDECIQQATTIYKESEIGETEFYAGSTLILGTPCNSKFLWQLLEPGKMTNPSCNQKDDCKAVANSLLKMCGEDVGLLTSYMPGTSTVLAVIGNTPAGIVHAASVLAGYLEHNVKCSSILVGKGGYNGDVPLIYCAGGPNFDMCLGDEAKEIECK